jgi:hypothetical protein
MVENLMREIVEDLESALCKLNEVLETARECDEESRTTIELMMIVSQLSRIMMAVEDF